MLALTKFFDSNGSVARIGRFEKRVSSISERLTVWAGLQRSLTVTVRMHESVIALITFVLYGLLATHTMWPIVMGILADDGSRGDGRVLSVLSMTTGTLVLPVLLLSRAIWKRWWMGIVGCGVACALFVIGCEWGGVCVRPEDRTVTTACVEIEENATVQVALMTTRDTLVGQRVLEEADRHTLEEVVFFERNRTEINNSYHLLRRKADVLTTNPYVQLRIEGHADSVGSTDYNSDLGSRRAGVVLEFFLDSAGLNPTRFDTVSYGERRPSDATPRTNSQNRRVEFAVTRRAPADSVMSRQKLIVLDTVIVTDERAGVANVREACVEAGYAERYRDVSR